MYPVSLVLPYAVLFLAAKLMEKGVKFYWAALIYTVSVYVLQGAIALLHFEPILTGLVLTYVVALPVFYLLDQFEDTIVKWLTTLIVGGAVLLWV